MTDGSKAGPYRTFIDEPNTGVSDAVRYALAIVIVAAFGASVLVWAGRTSATDKASDVDSAVLIDLPPAEASSQPASTAAEGPPQQATQASASQQAPRHVEPPKEQPVEELKPAPVTKPDTEPPPVMPDPSAVIERKQDEPSPPKPVAAPATQAQDERAPAGAESPVNTEVEVGDDARPHASAHAITVWQKSLMRRLETAKRLVDRQAHSPGTVRIAFAIDANGALSAERVLVSSGSASLDRAALLLVKQAAPFPVPPPGSKPHDTSFIVPIRFR